MLAQRADIILGKSIALVQVSADRADKSLLCLVLGSGLRLDDGAEQGVEVLAQLLDAEGRLADRNVHDVALVETVLDLTGFDVLNSIASSLSASLPLANPQCLYVSNFDFSVRMDTLKYPVSIIISCVRFALLTVTVILFGSVVTCVTVFTMHPLSLPSCLAVRMNRPYDRLYITLLSMLRLPFISK